MKVSLRFDFETRRSRVQMALLAASSHPNRVHHTFHDTINPKIPSVCQTFLRMLGMDDADQRILKARAYPLRAAKRPANIVIPSLSTSRTPVRPQRLTQMRSFSCCGCRDTRTRQFFPARSASCNHAFPRFPGFPAACFSSGRKYEMLCDLLS